MRAGKLKHLITIQQNTPTANSPDDGSLVDSWSSYAADIYGRLSTSGGREFWRARQLNSELSAEWEIRYDAGVTARMRVLFGSRVFTIDTVKHDDDRYTWTRMECVETNAS
jgi:SPP1 family predicted phage head-tail adaptor